MWLGAGDGSMLPRHGKPWRGRSSTVVVSPMRASRPRPRSRRFNGSARRASAHQRRADDARYGDRSARDYEASYHWHALAREGAIAWAGADDKRTTWYHVNLAGAAAKLGKLDEAQRFAEEALAVSQLGFKNLTTAHARDLGSVVAVRTGPDAAAPHYERARDLPRTRHTRAVADGRDGSRYDSRPAGRFDDARALFDEVDAAPRRAIRRGRCPRASRTVGASCS